MDCFEPDTERYGHSVAPERKIVAIRGDQALHINNAFLTFEENEKGSIEPGKRADWIVLDRDILECPLDTIPDTSVLKTYLDGKLIYQAK